LGGKPKIPNLSLQRARQIFAYDRATGVVTCIARTSPNDRRKVGAPAGSPDKEGYLVVCVDGESIKLHRLVWFMEKGRWPDGEIDHKDGKPANNRWRNLRDATTAQNCANVRTHKDNKSGFKGVSQIDGGRFRAVIHVRGVQKFLGRFATAEAAHAAYVSAAKAIHGEFARAA
jgi:hypothetical protein